MGPRAAALTFALLASACGAKTGLRLPDATSSPDAPDAVAEPDVADVPDGPDVCAPAPLPVERFAAEVIFVIDRSGSMGERTRSGITRWRAVTTALERVLPAVDRELWTGLTQFPGPITTDNQCGDNSRVELTPRSLHARELLAALGRTVPSGGTPTFAALETAAQWYRANPPSGRVRGRYLVLATDGGPNCNASLSSTACVCTNPRGCVGPRGPLSCLDADRTVELLDRVAREGVPTFVIGTPGDDVPLLPETLERMAVAGGRARPRRRPDDPLYYRAEDVDDFAAAFRAITTELVRCRYVTNPVEDPSRVRVTIAGRPIAQDRAHLDGWDWTSTATGEVVLYGAACEAAQRAEGAVSLRYACAE